MPRPWWRLSQLELTALLLGAAMGLVASAPLLWLTAEAQRTGNPGLSRAAQFFTWELLLVWLLGALTGGVVAASLSRRLVRLRGYATAAWRRRLLHLLVGIAIIIVLAPLPAALLLALLARQLAALLDFYAVGGSLIGWQSGVIAFVFLYTFRTLESLRSLPTKESA